MKRVSVTKLHRATLGLGERKGERELPTPQDRRQDVARTMQENLVHLTSNEIRIIPAGQRLVINLEEHIVTLVWTESAHILAQSQFPPSSFRALILLLKSPNGASYAEILASLHCSYRIIKQLLAARTSDDVTEFQVEAMHWQEHLAEAAARVARDPEALERELKPARFAVKEKRGIQPIARQKGFGWRVHVLPRRGYILLRPLSTAPEKSESRVTVTASRGSTG
jgi:hypothetical protein